MRYVRGPEDGFYGFRRAEKSMPKDGGSRTRRRRVRRERWIALKWFYFLFLSICIPLTKSSFHHPPKTEQTLRTRYRGTRYRGTRCRYG